MYFRIVRWCVVKQYYITNLFQYYQGGVIVNVIVSSAVDRVYKSLSGQTKDYEIGICCLSA
jgi:hypothetical protein